VCFNASPADDGVRAGLNVGIFVMMGVTAGVLAEFLRFIISIARLSKADVKVRLDDDNRTQSPVVEAGLQARLPI